ncbi:MAG: radical SAM protein, partial [Lactobacillales bacterium]|nr:radical SAM protein [Lactobacillales bacterium]
MKWSRYSKLFKSKRNGWLLYNSASNAFLKLDEQAVSAVQEIIKSPNTYDFSTAVSLYFQLRTSGFLVEDTKDDDLFNILKMRRLLIGYATDALSLTIAPTRNCNFGCHYCYEKNRTKSMMSEKTVENLLKFIEMHKSARKLFLVWYGGEPLLAYKKIKQINAGIEKLGIPYSAKMITNGYCLTPEICEELNDMHILGIQITIDGDKKTHDGRRFLIGGGKTFDRIVDNVDTLLRSSYKGTLNLRVNVDTRNSKEFANVYRFIQSKYDDKILKRVYVYPGFVHGEDNSPDISCFFDYVKKGEFVAKLA